MSGSTPTERIIAEGLLFLPELRDVAAVRLREIVESIARRIDGLPPQPSEGAGGISDEMVERAAKVVYGPAFGPNFKHFEDLREHDYPLGKEHYRREARRILTAAASPKEDTDE